MVIPATGPISFSALQGEFGGANPISISEYYRNNVTVKDIAENAAVPTSGQISASNFRSTAYTEPFRVQYLAGGGGGGGPAADPTGRLNVYVNTGIGVGFDTDPPAGATTYTYNGNIRAALLVAISFYKEF